MAQKIRWRLVPTPNPSELSIAIIVPQEEVAKNPAALPAIGSTFQTLEWQPDPGLSQESRFGLYVFTESHKEDLDVVFVYAKNKTPEERNTPFDSYQETQRIQWPAVLEWIQFGQETGFPLSQNYIDGSGQSSLVLSPRWLVRRGYRPAMNLETKVLVQKFLSEVPWPDWAIFSNEPQPTEVSWDLVGSHGNMGRCLHDEVIVPKNSNGYRVLSEAGDLSSSSSTYSGGQIFPKTNLTRWQNYEVVDVKKVDGQYLRVLYTYFAPTRPRLTEESS